MLAWSGVSRPRLFAILKVLCELRLIEQVRRGQKYQRAEYIVFPEGCCDRHEPISGSYGCDTEEGVDSLVHETLKVSQGLVSVSQGLVSDESGSCEQDPSLRSTLDNSQGFRRSLHSLAPVVQLRQSV